MASQINPFSAGLVADGAANGIVTVPDSDRFAIGAILTLQDSVGTPATVCKLASKAGVNKLVLTTVSGGAVDVSRWQVANGAYISQSSQTVSGTVPAEGSASKVVTGLMLVAPNGASTQATGTGDSVGNVGYDKGLILINGVMFEHAASGASDVTATWGTGTSDNIASGSSAIGTVYAFSNAGTLTFGMAKGVAAVTGNQVALSDAAVMAIASLTPTNYVRIGDVTFNRTGATTITQTQNNATRWF